MKLRLDLNSRYTIMIMLAFVATVCGVFAVYAEPGWPAMGDAAGVGFNVAGILYNWLMLRTDRLVADMHRNFDQMVEFHRMLRDGRALVIHGPFPPDEDEDMRPRPTLN